MKKMTIIKIVLVLVVLGFITYKIWDMGAFDKLDPPAPIKNEQVK